MPTFKFLTRRRVGSMAHVCTAEDVSLAYPGGSPPLEHASSASQARVGLECTAATGRVSTLVGLLLAGCPRAVRLSTGAAVVRLFNQHHAETLAPDACPAAHERSPTRMSGTGSAQSSWPFELRFGGFASWASLRSKDRVARADSGRIVDPR